MPSEQGSVSVDDVCLLQFHVADVQLHSDYTSDPRVCHGSQTECIFYSRDSHSFQGKGLQGKLA